MAPDPDSRLPRPPSADSPEALILTRELNDEFVIEISGRLGTVSVPRLQEVFNQALISGEPLVSFDLEAATGLNSLCMGLLLRFANRAVDSATTVRATRISDAVRRMFTQMHLDHMISIPD